MALKTRIEDLNEIPKELHGLYTQNEGGGFILQLEEDEELAKQRKAQQEEIERVKAHNQKLIEEKRKEAERARTAEEERARRERDVESLERSLQEKHQAEVAAREAKIGMLTSAMEQQMVDNVAHQLASDISDTPNLILPHIRSRLKATEQDGRWKTTVVDAMGNLTAISPQELAEQIRSDKSFAPLVRGTKAGGGGANGGNGAPSGGNDGNHKNSESHGDDRLARSRAVIQTKTW